MTNLTTCQTLDSHSVHSWNGPYPCAFFLPSRWHLHGITCLHGNVFKAQTIDLNASPVTNRFYNFRSRTFKSGTASSINSMLVFVEQNLTNTWPWEAPGPLQMDSCRVRIHAILESLNALRKTCEEILMRYHWHGAWHI